MELVEFMLLLGDLKGGALDAALMSGLSLLLISIATFAKSRAAIGRAVVITSKFVRPGGQSSLFLVQRQSVASPDLQAPQAVVQQ